jgi:hypothetical protein
LSTRPLANCISRVADLVEVELSRQREQSEKEVADLQAKEAAQIEQSRKDARVKADRDAGVPRLLEW